MCGRGPTARGDGAWDRAARAASGGMGACGRRAPGTGGKEAVRARGRPAAGSRLIEGVALAPVEPVVDVDVARGEVVRYVAEEAPHPRLEDIAHRLSQPLSVQQRVVPLRAERRRSRELRRGSLEGPRGEDWGRGRAPPCGRRCTPRPSHGRRIQPTRSCTPRRASRAPRPGSTARVASSPMRGPQRRARGSRSRRSQRTAATEVRVAQGQCGRGVRLHGGSASRLTTAPRRDLAGLIPARPQQHRCPPRAPVASSTCTSSRGFGWWARCPSRGRSGRVSA